MPFVMKEDVALDPIDVGSLGANTVMFASDDVPHLVEQLWFARGRHSHYPVRHENDFALPTLKLKPD